MVNIDWAEGSFTAEIISSEPIWKNVAISKDGRKLAALFSDEDDQIFILDLLTEDVIAYDLYNPTTAQGGFNSEEVQYADVIEWDLTSQYLVYDAYNEVAGFGGSLAFWDIGFIRIWDNETESFSDGLIQTLVTNLDEGIDIGNPTFSSNSPNIMAFDLLDNNQGLAGGFTYDIETGDFAQFYLNNTGLPGRPDFSPDDQFILYDTESNGTRLIARIPLSDDTLTPPGSPTAFLTGGTWANWFATGQRVITSTDDVLDGNAGDDLQVFPNPFTGHLQVAFELAQPAEVLLELFDVFGRRVQQLREQSLPGAFQTQIDTEGLSPGAYLLRIRAGNQTVSRKLIKSR